MRREGRLSTICLLLAISSCGESTAPASPRLVALGRLERGLTVRFVVVTGADTASVPANTLALSPGGSAAMQSDGSVLLVGTGMLAATVTVSDGTTVSASFTISAPPKILFDMVVDGNRDIYRASLDGNDVERLTTDQADDVHPSMARGRVVFSSYRDGRAELYELGASGGAGDRRLTITSANNTAAALSPDGRRLAYVRDDGTAPKVWLAAADATGGAPLTAGFGSAASVEGSPTWSARSDTLAIMATALGAPSIYRVVASLGASPLVVAKPNGNVAYVEPAWSADGKRIAFVSGGAAGPSQIVVLDLATGSSTTLTRGTSSAGQPAWLPDGRLVFTVFTAGAGRLFWLDPAAPDVVYPIAVTGTDSQRATANAP
jgi:Tol biopolymer transport system component